MKTASVIQLTGKKKLANIKSTCVTKSDQPRPRIENVDVGILSVFILWMGTGGRGIGRKGGGRCRRSGKTGGEKWDYKGGGKREKKGKIEKCKEVGANKYRAGTGIKGYGKREV